MQPHPASCIHQVRTDRSRQDLHHVWHQGPDPEPCRSQTADRSARSALGFGATGPSLLRVRGLGSTRIRNTSLRGEETSLAQASRDIRHVLHAAGLVLALSHPIFSQSLSPMKLGRLAVASWVPLALGWLHDEDGQIRCSGAFLLARESMLAQKNRPSPHRWDQRCGCQRSCNICWVCPITCNSQ